MSARRLLRGLAFSAVTGVAACRPAGMPTAGGLVVTGIEYSGECDFCTASSNERQRQKVPADALLDVVPWLDETGVSSLPGGTVNHVYTDGHPPRLIVHFADQPTRAFDVTDCYEPSVCAFLDRLEDARLIHRSDKSGCDPAAFAARLRRWAAEPELASSVERKMEEHGGICEMDPSACPKATDIRALANAIWGPRGPDGRCRIHRDGWPVGSRSRAMPTGG